MADPQWPQAFYPTDALIDVKDGNALIGICTYHNDENRYVYAGSTHNDEMCNVYLMYYADNVDDVMDICDGNAYPQLESVIPAEAEVRPPPPASFSSDDSKKDSMSHHDMEGSKMHHDLIDTSQNNNNNNNNKNDKQIQKSLINLLSEGLSGVGVNDDYYDDIERSRSKSRISNSNNDDLASNNDDSQTFYDAKDLIDALSSDDYQSLPDSDPSLLLASTLDKLNSGSNKKSNLNKIKFKLNSLSKTVASKL